MKSKKTTKRATTPQQQVMGIASMREVHAAFEWFRRGESEILQQQIELLKIPAPPFGEAARAEWLRQQFVAQGLEDVRLDEIGNVIGVSPGQREAHDASKRAVMLSAHIDTVFHETKYEVVRSANGFGTRISAPGASDNAAGVAALLALAHVLGKGRKLQHNADILFVGNVGEEGEGDLRGMRHLWASEIARGIAYSLVLDGTGTDSIVTQALGSRRFEITVHGPGGHSWQDYGRPNPIHVLARAISLFQDSPVPHEPRTTINIGSIAGGTSVNTIPESAVMRVDIRSVATEEIERLESALRKAVQLAVNEQLRRTGAKRDVVHSEIRQIGDRPAAELKSGAHILEVLRAVDAHLGIRAEIRRSSTDANVPLALGREAVSIGTGGTGSGAHTLREWFDTAGRDLALKRILLAALALAE
jgi:acetylornithine deacetylase/succinyl-diaminopimelate desuccinylase-like protein